jgi:hypothetical protein
VAYDNELNFGVPKHGEDGKTPSHRWIGYMFCHRLTMFKGSNSNISLLISGTKTPEEAEVAQQ